MHLIQRPRYQRGSLCQDPTGSRTDHRKEALTKWYRHVSRSFMAKTNMRTTVKGGRRQGRHTNTQKKKNRREDNIRDWTEGIGEQRPIEETGCEVISGAPTTPAIKGQMKGEDGKSPRSLPLRKLHFTEKTPVWRDPEHLQPGQDRFPTASKFALPGAVTQTRTGHLRGTRPVDKVMILTLTHRGALTSRELHR